MPERGLLFTFLILLAVAGWLFTQGYPERRAGSAYCRKCHIDAYRAWQNNPNRQSCESCHGPARHHALAPTRNNIRKPERTGYSHGPEVLPPARKPEKVVIDLFVMSLCPYGIQAEKRIIPIIRKWAPYLEWNLYFIAHRRGENRPQGPVADPMPGEPDRCRANDQWDMVDGTENFVSLHGLDEVLENMRQLLIKQLFPARFLDYLEYRIFNLDGKWEDAATVARLSESDIDTVKALMETPYSDSLFNTNIQVANRRGITGSPTLFIDGAELAGKISPYAVERRFCMGRKQTGPCADFPECGYDGDCRKPGMAGKCVNPGKPDARCQYTRAVRFEVTIVNDHECPNCHTGNIVAEIMRRFPGAQFVFMDVSAKEGKALIRRYALKSYPAFLFGEAVEQSARFKAIRHTFTKRKDCYHLNRSVIKTFHLLNRKKQKGRLALIGSAQNPPVIEAIRDMEPFLHDSAFNAAISFHPFSVEDRNSEKKPKTWLDRYISPYGPSEVRAGLRQLCVLDRYPVQKAWQYLRCRGFNVQRRFEKRIPEPKDEWVECARQLKLDSAKIAVCFHGPKGKTLFQKNRQFLDTLGTSEAGPAVLLNNNFYITGYNPAVKKIILEALE